MKFFTKKRRADGVEMSHYHGEGFFNTCESKTYCRAEGYATADTFEVPVVEGNKVKNDDDGISVFTIDKSYTDRGATLDISFSITYPYDKYMVFEFPQSCSACPIGFSNNGECGRNIPFTDDDYKQRPATCKLKKASYKDIKNIIEHNVKFFL